MGKAMRSIPRAQNNWMSCFLCSPISRILAIEFWIWVMGPEKSKI